jgi:DNA-binding transcriptional LysR family regulator
MQHDCAIMFEKLFAQSGLSLDRLKAFAEIVAAGGITAAAGEDSNRQSQLSRQLKELERYFGAELLKRGRGPMRLTAAGKQLHQIVGQTFSALGEFHQSCAQQPVELVLGAGESLIQWLLLPRLARLQAQHPQVNLTLQNLRTDEILDGLVEGCLDLGVVSRPATHPALAAAPLGRLDYGLFVPAGAVKELAAHAKHGSDILGTLPLAELAGSSSISAALEQEARKRRLTLDLRWRFSSYPQLAQALLCLKVGVVMPTLAQDSLPAGAYELIRLPFLDQLTRRLALVWNRKLVDVRPALQTYSQAFAMLFRKSEEPR